MSNMRLLDTSRHRLEEFFEPDISHYAIISHRWGDDEVSFKDLKKGNVRTELGQLRSGWSKILASCSLAQSRGLDWVWIDTCCIDKRSSAELSEAINSMYRGYNKSYECYAYLNDVLWDEESLQHSQERALESLWFSRGWNLQELLAPDYVVFFDQHWTQIGTRRELREPISKITGIHIKDLCKNERRHLQRDDSQVICTRSADCEYHKIFTKASIATKMSWASKRKTTRIENMAYCLLGIFDINMPLLYGEGGKAFQRLQQELIKGSDDESIFIFERKWDLGGYMARYPRDFSRSSFVHQISALESVKLDSLSNMSRPAYTMTNRGFELPLTYRSFQDEILKVPIDCWQCCDGGPKRFVLTFEVHKIDKTRLASDETLLSSHFGHEIIEDFDTFYSPGRTSHDNKGYWVWSPGQRREYYSFGHLSDIMGGMAFVKRIILGSEYYSILRERTREKVY